MSEHMDWVREQARIARQHLANPPKELQALHDAEIRAACLKAAGFGTVLDAAAERLVGESTRDPELRYALVTKAVDNGVMVGDWLISNTEDGFSVTNVRSYEVAAVGVHLYDVALAVTQRLVDGNHARSYDLRHLLDLDRDYALAVTDVNWLRDRIRAAPMERAAVLEDRYDHAVQRMFAARNTIRRLLAK